ncbi:MAG: helix-turn-helix transcriptional regulator [Candidatus Eisenbacteria bacterium]|nr:helix-turn-helix transcriptional regulator [Candidatus Eisenbacteria bacterium]
MEEKQGTKDRERSTTTTKEGTMTLHIAQELRASREARGLSQAELALLSRISRSYLSDLERGKRNPSIGILEELAKSLHGTLDLRLKV